MVHWEHTSDETLKERLLGKIFIMLLEMLFGGSDELYGCELVPCSLVSIRVLVGRNADTHPRFSNLEMMSPTSPRYDQVNLYTLCRAYTPRSMSKWLTWTPSGLIAINLLMNELQCQLPSSRKV